jgi:hypothetical protein
MKVLAMLACLCVLTVSGCEPHAGAIERIAQTAGAPSGGRAAVAAAVVQGMKEKTFAVGDVIDFAYDRLEKAARGSNGASPNPTESLAATAMAGGILDAIASLKKELPQGSEHEIFWMKVGRLAFKAGEEAFANQRLPEAHSLALGGSARWQNEPYWLRYPDHDALVSAILAMEGDRAGAIQRLQARTDLSGPAQEVYEKLKGR